MASSSVILVPSDVSTIFCISLMRANEPLGYCKKKALGKFYETASTSCDLNSHLKGNIQPWWLNGDDGSIARSLLIGHIKCQERHNKRAQQSNVVAVVVNWATVSACPSSLSHQAF